METQKQSNNMLIPIIILVFFIIFIGLVVTNLFTQVTNNETVILQKDSNIGQLTIDLNTANNILDEKKAELVVVNADKASLIVERDTAVSENVLAQTALNNKIDEYNVLFGDYNVLDGNYNDLNIAYIDLNTEFIMTDLNYNESLNIITDLNTVSRGMYSDLFDCYLAIRCVDDRNRCMSIYGYNELDLNNNLIIWDANCNSILQSDLNLYKEYFE